MMRLRRTQQGMTLLIAMILLVVITLFVVSMVRLGGTNAAIVGNMQAQKAVAAEAQQAVEVALSSYAFLDDVIGNKGYWGTKTTLTYAELWSNYAPSGASAAPATQSSSIVLSRPQCTYFETAPGYSALSGVAPQDTYWDVQVNATDSFTTATTEIHQGFRVRVPPGNCP